MAFKSSRFKPKSPYLSSPKNRKPLDDNARESDVYACFQFRFEQCEVLKFFFKETQYAIPSHQLALAPSLTVCRRVFMQWQLDMLALVSPITRNHSQITACPVSPSHLLKLTTAGNNQTLGVSWLTTKSQQVSRVEACTNSKLGLQSRRP